MPPGRCRPDDDDRRRLVGQLAGQPGRLLAGPRIAQEPVDVGEPGAGRHDRPVALGADLPGVQDHDIRGIERVDSARDGLQIVDEPDAREAEQAGQPVGVLPSRRAGGGLHLFPPGEA